MNHESAALLLFPQLLAGNLDVAWTFFLLMIRFGAMMLVLPGIGAVTRSAAIKAPAVFVLALASTVTSPRARIPPDWGVMIGQASSEFLLGYALGLIPFI